MGVGSGIVYITKRRDAVRGSVGELDLDCLKSENQVGDLDDKCVNCLVDQVSKK